MKTPDEKNLAPEDRLEVQRALRMGTFGKIDRTEQYKGSDRATPHQLLRAVNKANNDVRALQAEKDRIYQKIFNLKLRNAVIVASITGAIARGPEIWAWISGLFR